MASSLATHQFAGAAAQFKCVARPRARVSVARFALVARRLALFFQLRRRAARALGATSPPSARPER